jgi:hypothetical protein
LRSGTFAKSNIVFIDGKLTFNDYSDDATRSAISAGSQGLHFKWGSLVGIEPKGEAGTTWDKSSICFIPSEYSGGALDGYATILSIPASSAKESDKTLDYFKKLYAETGYDAAAAQGDICRYISDKGWVDGKWRMPTASEYEALYNKTQSFNIPGYFGYVEGFSGAETITATGGTQVLKTILYLGEGVVDGSTASDVGETVVAVPSAGTRGGGSGSLLTPGSTSNHWSCSPYGDYCYTSSFTGTMVRPTNSGVRNGGFSVRCVTE